MSLSLLIFGYEFEYRRVSMKNTMDSKSCDIDDVEEEVVLLFDAAAVDLLLLGLAQAPAG